MATTVFGMMVTIITGQPRIATRYFSRRAGLIEEKSDPLGLDCPARRREVSITASAT